jgi:hypothetical protein
MVLFAGPGKSVSEVARDGLKLPVADERPLFPKAVVQSIRKIRNRRAAFGHKRSVTINLSQSQVTSSSTHKGR